MCACFAAVSASGGTPSPVTRVDPEAVETLHVWPTFLPGGRHFLYVRRSITNEPQVYLHALDGGAETRLPIDATMVQVAGGFVWFVRDRTLMAQPLDATRHLPTGSPIAVTEDVRVADRGPTGPDTHLFTVSPAGVAAFQADAAPGFELVWYDRHGKRVGTLGAPADYADTVVSPDGTRVLVSKQRGSTTARDLWVYEVDRGVGSRVTSDDVRVLHGGVWARDGVHVIYTGERGGRLQILQRRLASSPAAIFHSLRRRRERMEARLNEERLVARGGALQMTPRLSAILSDDEDSNLDEAGGEELEQAEQEVVDRATAAETIAELEAEIIILRQLEALAERPSAGTKAVDPLIQVLADSDASVRASAALALGNVGKDARRATDALVTAQRAWVAFRDANCALSGFQARGGSMEPMLISSCLAEMSGKRAEELRQLSEGF